MENAIRVMIGITTEGWDDSGQLDAARLMLPGEMAVRDGDWLVRYEESVTDDDGGADRTKVRLRARDGRVTMTRSGAYSSLMVFSRGQRFEGMYKTPFGELPMAIYATRVRVTGVAGGFEMELEYQLEIEGSRPMMRRMRMICAEEGR